MRSGVGRPARLPVTGVTGALNLWKARRKFSTVIALASMADAGKVRVHFKAVGGAPVMKKNKFLIAESESFGTVGGALAGAEAGQRAGSLGVGCRGDAVARIQTSCPPPPELEWPFVWNKACVVWFVAAVARSRQLPPWRQ
jgi:hypothetical protein